MCQYEESKYVSLLSNLAKVAFFFFFVVVEEAMFTFGNLVLLGSSLPNLFISHWRVRLLSDIHACLSGWVWHLHGWRLFATWCLVGRSLVDCGYLKSKGLSSEAISDLCSLCGEGRESADHYFLSL